MLGDGIVSFGTAVVHGVAQEGEVVGEDRVLEPHGRGDTHRSRREADRAGLVPELDDEVGRQLLDAAELVDEVHVP